VLMLGVGCSSGTIPTLPTNEIGNQQLGVAAYDFTNMPVGEVKLTDFSGNVLAWGLLGRNEDGSLYVIKSRGAQIDMTPAVLGSVDCKVSYQNPVGTAGNGLPYFYKGTTMYYDLNITSVFPIEIGSGSSPAKVQAEHRRAYLYPDKIIIGELMKGEAVFIWEGSIPPGYKKLTDDYYIDPTNISGNFVTTCKITAPVMFGLLEVVFFEAACGVFDP